MGKKSKKEIAAAIQAGRNAKKIVEERGIKPAYWKGYSLANLKAIKKAVDDALNKKQETEDVVVIEELEKRGYKVEKNQAPEKK